jgi:hypothetical protein
MTLQTVPINWLFYQKKSTKLDILFLGDYGEKIQCMIDFEFRKWYGRKNNSTLLIHCKAKNKLKYMDEMEFDQTSQ